MIFNYHSIFQTKKKNINLFLHQFFDNGISRIFFQKVMVKNKTRTIFNDFPRIFCLVVLLNFRTYTDADNFTMGYLTGTQRRPGNKEYPRPGLIISGAIGLAVDEINQNHSLVDDHLLTFEIAETYGEEKESIYQTALLWTRKVAVYLGPQETCIHEAKMASSFNLPMISYVSLFFL